MEVIAPQNPEDFFERHESGFKNPVLLSETLQVLRNPVCSADTLVKSLEKEPALCSRVLRAANSAFFGTPRTISSLKAAIVRLGNQNVAQLALAATLTEPPSPKWALFWRHSYAVALLSRHIARSYRIYTPQEEEEFFSMGLLHDLGVLFIIASGMFPRVESELEAGTLTLEEAEVKALGFNHEQLGQVIAVRWNFPGDLRHAIANHHHPELSGDYYRKIVIVHIANLICHGFRLTIHPQAAEPTTDESYLQEARLPVEQLVLFGEWLLAQQAEIDEFGQSFSG